MRFKEEQTKGRERWFEVIVFKGEEKRKNCKDKEIQRDIEILKD